MNLSLLAEEGSLCVRCLLALGAVVADEVLAVLAGAGGGDHEPTAKAAHAAVPGLVVGHVDGGGDVVVMRRHSCVVCRWVWYVCGCECECECQVKMWK